MSFSFHTPLSLITSNISAALLFPRSEILLFIVMMNLSFSRVRKLLAESCTLKVRLVTNPSSFSVMLAVVLEANNVFVVPVGAVTTPLIDGVFASTLSIFSIAINIKGAEHQPVTDIIGGHGIGFFCSYHYFWGVDMKPLNFYRPISVTVRIGFAA